MIFILRLCKTLFLKKRNATAKNLKNLEIQGFFKTILLKLASALKMAFLFIFTITLGESDEKTITAEKIFKFIYKILLP